MPTLSEVFRTIHRLRQRTRDLQAEIDRGPVQLKARKTFAAKQAAATQKAKEDLKKLQITTREREADLKAAHQQLERFRKQLNDVADKKQYDALQHEIAETQQNCVSIEDSILQQMSQADEMASAIPALEQAEKKALADLNAFEAEQADRIGQLTTDLRAAQDELKNLEAEIPADIRPEYVRRVASYGADALSTAESGSCSYCHTGIAAQVKLQLQMNQFVTCTTCYRVLYLP